MGGASGVRRFAPDATFAPMQCRHCDAPLAGDERFCPRCGHPLPTQRVSRNPAVVSGDVDVTLVAELQDEKRRLDRRLRELLDLADVRQLTAAEREEWAKTHRLWQRVTGALTRQMQYLEAREHYERRGGERRSEERRKQQVAIDVPERRSGQDRRRRERRSGADRRTPYPPTPP